MGKVRFFNNFPMQINKILQMSPMVSHPHANHRTIQYFSPLPCSHTLSRTQKPKEVRYPCRQLAGGVLVAASSDVMPAVHSRRGNPRQGESENVDGNIRLALDPLVQLQCSCLASLRSHFFSGL